MVAPIIPIALAAASVATSVVKNGKSSPERPQLPYFDDTDYISQSRRMQNLGYRQATKALENVDTLNDNTRNELQNVANQYTQNQWSDLNRNYTKQMNQMNQANYQRFGSTGSTPALYNTESAQRAYNDLASQTAAQTAAAYNDLINSEYKRRLNNLDAAYGVFTNSGNTAYNHDKLNYQTKLYNLGVQLQNEQDDYNRNQNLLGGISSGLAMGAGAAGGAAFGPGIGSLMTSGLQSINNPQNASSLMSGVLGNSLLDRVGAYNALNNWGGNLLGTISNGKKTGSGTSSPLSTLNQSYSNSSPIASAVNNYISNPFGGINWSI